ncbi:GNAT family N-acetyltransferase [Glaciibacter flavus]|uniref:GNAT family N-acetyltransferase n=1 Tax=Orlajensenia flava TaxID=2565934 RepID=A0A4S4FS90_9MICO|nr:GNAT family N-acetyltransferase [Glaciibacter flavus]THG32575.1 GNAT family N-acetyltransferase [Glaciibacter flavus]
MVGDDTATRARLLAAYDEQLRTDAETPSAIAVTRLGPLRLVTFRGGRGFITYRGLGDVDAGDVARLVRDGLAHFATDTAITRVEWKTRGHDHAPGLHEALLQNGFVPDERESIMVGEARALAVDVALPPGVRLRRVTEEHDVRAMAAMQDEVFGDPVSDAPADALLHRLSLDDGMQLWIAEANGEIVTAGRLEPVANTDFAGIWGGATRSEWRGRGIYRALTAARARAAIALGKTLIHSDSTEYSRPILEQAGLIAVSSTTPYLWKR